jgi:hypothetical protein
MNFDYRGTIVQKSTPTAELRTIKKTLHVDSSDRDTGIYFTNGEFVVYLPRVYEKVVSLRLMSAEFPPLDLAWSHSYTNGSNISTATYSADTSLLASSSNAPPNYFIVDIDGLNKGDETSVASQRSQYADSFYAKIASIITTKSGYVPSGAVTASNLPTGSLIEYNDHSGMENVSHFSPPIGKLDRLRIRTRLHSQQGSQGFIYWSLSNATTAYASAGSSNTNVVNFCMTFEIEYLDNGFDNFSSMQTRLGPNDRA